MILSEILQREYQRPVRECTDIEIFAALLKEVYRRSEQRRCTASAKKLYYISAEFLIGKLLSNDMINLGIYDEVKRELSENGRSISAIEELECEPSLGNGGLGRLAACFLDSIATLGLNGDGIGLCYHLGLFRQVFENNTQTTQPDRWLNKFSPLHRTDTVYTVRFRGRELQTRMYDINVTGYEGVTNKLHLFDVETADESILGDGISFNKSDIPKNLTLFLYPDDSDEEGRLLRIYQQYLMVSCGAQLILDEVVRKGGDISRLYEHAVIQINDTHPTMMIPELIRLLTERGIEMDEAIRIVSRTCAYTNHTILAEALEKWEVKQLKKVVPQLLPIIEVLDDKVRRLYQDTALHIIDSNERVHMANICIHCCFSVNGVAKLHTDILKNVELHHFYEVYPEKFNNKTNGITFRRWLMHCNGALSQLITELIGSGWKKDAMQLKRLLDHREDSEVLEALLRIKQQNKTALSDWLKAKQGITVDDSSVFDIQIKRLHEYKRQQMNVLYVIHKYLEIKSGSLPSTPVTVIFGAKAAPAYTIAQDIIHLILCMQQLISEDKDVCRYFNVVMVENYNVTAAEKLIPACDISQQISLASKEASGTGNMKLMLNGAVTLGTEDGANVEIHSLVGDENIYIFGDSSETVVQRYKSGSYRAEDYYSSDPVIKRAVDFITGKELLALGDRKRLERLSAELRGKDWFMTFPDFADYITTRERAYADYADRRKWAEKMLINIANAGYFSSDRTIAEYNRDIWSL